MYLHFSLGCCLEMYLPPAEVENHFRLGAFLSSHLPLHLRPLLPFRSDTGDQGFTCLFWGCDSILIKLPARESMQETQGLPVFPR